MAEQEQNGIVAALAEAAAAGPDRVAHIVVEPIRPKLGHMGRYECWWVSERGNTVALSVHKTRPEADARAAEWAEHYGVRVRS